MEVRFLRRSPRTYNPSILWYALLLRGSYGSLPRATYEGDTDQNSTPCLSLTYGYIRNRQSTLIEFLAPPWTEFNWRSPLRGNGSGRRHCPHPTQTHSFVRRSHRAMQLFA